jgi:hypothetical protein
MTPNVRRAAAHKAMRDHNISQRRACRLVGVDPKTVRRDQSPDNPEVREEMKVIASKRRRFGYRRIGVLLERKGMIMNHKKLYRLYAEEKLGVRRRRGVIPPFLTGFVFRLHAACCRFLVSFIAGVIPPIAILGRSLLYVHSQRVA